MRQPNRYGSLYWYIKTKLSGDGDIYVHADFVQVSETGALEFLYEREGEWFLSLAIAPGEWQAVYAASLVDGSPVAVELWEGQIKS